MTQIAAPLDKPRIASIDILRALTMLGMIFVNDIPALKNIPAWLGHVPADADGMGLADIVFPGFLFIVGMSVPFAVRNRQAKGDKIVQLSTHVLTRALALILMGVFLVNGEYINGTASNMSRGAWNLLSCSAFILLWNQYPRKWNLVLKRSLQAVGILVLIFLAYRYRGGEGGSITGFSTWWWGILGLIGWAYLISALVFIFSGGRMLPLLVGLLASILLSAAHHLNGLQEGGIIQTLISPFEKGAMTALTIGGAVASQVFWSLKNKPDIFKKLFLYFTAAAVVLLIAGFASRPLWGISKIRATPSWVFICSAIMLLSFLVVYFLVDIKSKQHWFNLIKPAGTETLLCYLLPYYYYALVAFTGFALPAFLMAGIPGLVKSLFFSLLIIMFAGWLSKRGVRLKL